MIVIKIIICLYALLMLLAAIQDFKNNKIFSMLIITTTLVIIVSFFLPTVLFQVLSVAGLIIFQIMAIYHGLAQHNFHLVHHMIRLMVTVTMILAVLFS